MIFTFDQSVFNFWKIVLIERTPIARWRNDGNLLEISNILPQKSSKICNGKFLAILRKTLKIEVKSNKRENFHLFGNQESSLKMLI